MKWFERSLEIRYADTDNMGVVHHAVYPIFCELLRTHLMDEVGLPYTEVEKAGYFLMVSDIYCRYKLPARYGDRIVGRAAITRLNKRLIAFDYEIAREDGTVLCTAYSKHVVTRGTERTASLPEHFSEKMRAAL
jgi:acyl-CoA thioester hydrolase